MHVSMVLSPPLPGYSYFMLTRSSYSSSHTTHKQTSLLDVASSNFVSDFLLFGTADAHSQC